MSRDPQLDIKSLVLNQAAMKKGWSVISSFNDAIDNVKRVTTDVVTLNRSNSIDESFINMNSKLNDLDKHINYNTGVQKIEVGQIYGRLKNEIKLMQIFEGKIKSMGFIEITFINSNIDPLEFEFKWKRKYGESLMDITNSTSETKYNLTADDIGTIIIVEIKPKNDSTDSLNVTYGEIGPINIDESTKTSLSKLLKTGIIRFPIKIKDEYDIDDCFNKDKFSNNENYMIKDILVVTNDEIKVVRNGMSSINTSFDKKVEWSAKYFGGNVRIIIDHNTSQDFSLCSGYEIHKQSIRIQATSKNARDIITLTIRCFNIRHSISLETIIEEGLSWVINEDKNKIVLDETQKINVLSYIGKLEDEISIFLMKESKYNEEKRRIQSEKSVLENELSETITAYQDIISQYQMEKEEKNQLHNLFSNEILPLKLSNVSRGLINGYGNSQFSEESKKHVTKFDHLKDKNHSQKEFENNSRKESVSYNTNTDLLYGNEPIINDDTSNNFDSLKEEILILKKQLEVLNTEKNEFLALIDQQKIDIKEKDNKLKQLQSYDLESIRQQKNKIQELQDKILELQSQNFEKQEAIQVLSTEKSRLLKDYSNLKLEFDQLKNEHNQLNKKYICLNIQNSKNAESLSNKELITDNNNLRENIQELNEELEKYKLTNLELNETINKLKSRIRKLAMIEST